MKGPLRGTLRWVWYSFLPVPFPWPTYNGAWMLLYRDEQGLGLLRGYEKGVTNFVKSYVKPGMVCVDVGANQGYYTLLLSKLVGPEGKVVAFEPVLQEATRLMRNFRLNRRLGEVDEAPGIKYLFQNVNLNTIAVGSRLSIRAFFITRKHESRSSLALPPDVVEGVPTPTTVSVTTLDHFMRSKVDFLKIDAEGAELEILKGASRILSEDRPIIAIEVADIATRQFGYPAGELLEVLASFDYQTFPLREAPKSYTKKDWHNEEVAAIPQERIHEFKT